MGNKIELEAKIEDFKKNQKYKRDVEDGWKKHAEFLSRYPFRKNPEQIDNLSPQDIYNPGGEYFFDWIEHKLKVLGHLYIGSAKVWENARDNAEILKELLKVVVNNSLSISEKIDSHWEDIKGFRGDRHIAKKILFCYYPEKVICAYKTEDLEELAEALNLDYRKKSYEKYKEDYNFLSVGQKWELFNDLLLAFKNQHPQLKNFDNGLFVGFLYTSFPVSRITNKQTNKAGSGRKFKPFSPFGLVSEPKYEQEVVFLFSKFHIKLGFPLITKIAPAFPDAEALDEKGKYKKIEFEVMSGDFISHGHNPKECDYIICWEDNLTEEQKKRKELPQVISLKEELEK
ncbi:MAG: hypothetical protein Q8N22_03560 [bacterium]|nr:hypothetical protein [bacterium]